MSDKYPSLSPYVYCANNPVKLVDPNGEDYEVVVDDKSKTITIKATYYTNQKNIDRVSKGAQAWNNESGNYEYTSNDGKTYSVNFDLTVESRESPNNIKEAQGAWNWVTTKAFGNDTRGESDGVNILLDVDQDKAQTRTTIHEMGHTLGIGEDKYGVMKSGGMSDIILDEHIMTILKGAGINSTNGSSNNSINNTASKEEAKCTTRYNMNGSFRRKGL